MFIWDWFQQFLNWFPLGMAQWDGTILDDKRFHGGVRHGVCIQSLLGLRDKEETCFCGLPALASSVWCDPCKWIPTKNAAQFCSVCVESQSQGLSSYNHPRSSVIIPKDHYSWNALLMLWNKIITVKSWSQRMYLAEYTECSCLLAVSFVPELLEPIPASGNKPEIKEAEWRTYVFKDLW